jgi:hypothetical protein
MQPIARGDQGHHFYVNPFTELNVGLWSLFTGASVFLALRIWVKLSWGHRLWYDDYILIVSWMVLLANNSIIIHEFATGYVLEDSTKKWDDRMHILINISSCGTLIGQAWTKSAFGVTLLRIADRRQAYFLWFCIITMNLWMVAKVVFQWAKVCDKPSYQNWYRLDFCIGWRFRDDFKEGGNIYNIVMDFVFATIPWLIARRLEMRRVEKIGLCFTMSLGIIVAIVAAVRVSWKDQGNKRDEMYIWRNGMSQIWYSSEVAGTILVQCIPVLRPIIRDIHTTMTSKRLDATGDTPSTVFSKRFSSRAGSNGINYADKFQEGTNGNLELKPIPEQHVETWAESPIISPVHDYFDKKEVSRARGKTESWPLSDNKEEITRPKPRTDSWPLSDDYIRDDLADRRSTDLEQGRTSRSTFSMDEQVGGHGLSAPPRGWHKGDQARSSW